MTISARAFLIFFSIALIIFAWLFRIDSKNGGSGQIIITDRWAGTVYVCTFPTMPHSCARWYPGF
jgi:hypothetical protein